MKGAGLWAVGRARNGEGAGATPISCPRGSPQLFLALIQVTSLTHLSRSATGLWLRSLALGSYVVPDMGSETNQGDSVGERQNHFCLL